MSQAASATLSPAVGRELVSLTADFYDLVASVERSLSRSGLNRDRLHEKTVELAERFGAFRARTAHDVSDAIDRVAANLHSFVAELRATRPSHADLRLRWRSLSRDYEALVAQIRRLRLELPAGLTLRHVKPRNLSRNVFHVANGVGAVLLYELVLPLGGLLAVGGALLAAFIGLDIARRISPRLNDKLVGGAFATIVRPNEAHRTPAATWYLAALLLGAALLPQHAIELGALVLAVGDPTAALVGKRWGRRKLLGDKSVLGSLAFATAASLTGIGFLLLIEPQLAPARLLLVAVAAAVAGSVAELGSDRLEDNFTVPLLAAGVAALLL
jgi:dolichol kinase